MKRNPREYEKVMDDLVMKYAPKYIGAFKGKTDEDLRDYLSEYVDKSGGTDFSPDFISQLQKTRSWRGMAEGEEPEPFDQKNIRAAAKAELRRGAQSRRQDEARTAKDTRQVNKETLRLWRKNPGRLDLKDIDDKQHRWLRGEFTRKIREQRAKGRDIRRYGNLAVFRDKRGNLHNALNGEFVKKPKTKEGVRR